MKGLSLVIVAILTLAAGLGLTRADDPPRRPSFQEETSLEKGVDQFNAYVKSFEDRGFAVGINEPLLTEDEVIAAIRGWDTKLHPVEPDMLRRFQQIAETRTLPAGSELRFTKQWTGFNGYSFDVWWIDLTVFTPQPAVGYTYRIRARTIRSRPMTEKEKKDAEKRALRLRPVEKDRKPDK